MMRGRQSIHRGLQSISLRALLRAIFVGFFFLCLTLFGIILYQSQNIALEESRQLSRANLQLRRTLELREAFTEIRGAQTLNRVTRDQIIRFRHAISEARQDEGAPAVWALFEKLDLLFENYLRESRRLGRDLDLQQEREVSRLSDEIHATLSSIAIQRSASISKLLGESSEDLWATIHWAMLITAIFGFLIVLGGMRVIHWVTEPFSVLARYLDEVNVEDNLPNQLPDFKWKSPEFARVARSFERLIERLQGYRALNFKRLLIEKRRADIIAASISDGIFLLRDEEILYANPVAERMLRLGPGRSWKGFVLSKSVSQDETLEPDTRQAVRALVSSLQSTIPVEYRLEQGDRSSFYLLQAYPITEEVIEQVEHSFNTSIERFLDRWKANVLVVARDVTLVREGQEAKSHFLATLSHEIKTPVTSLTMATRLLKKGIEQLPNPSHQKLVQTCVEDVDRLRGLLDDLLSVSRFDTLTQRLELKWVDLAKLLRQSIQHFQPQAFERGVMLQLSVGDIERGVMVSMDATKLSWAISNLLTNALRHAPRGGKVSVSLESRDAGVEVRIKDDGPGIDRKRQERLFDRFNPFYDLRVARSGSIGMGLAIAREIIVAHGGRIWVTSEPGEGAEFCFVIPYRREQKMLDKAVEKDLGATAKGETSGASAGRG